MRGFSLIETLVYLALFAILMSGAVIAAYNLFESAGRAQTYLMLEEEGNFIMAKINWAVSGAQSVSEPSGYGLELSVDTAAGSVTFSTSSSDIVIRHGGAEPFVLNNSNISIERLGFLHAHSGNGSESESITASTTLTARTPSGAVLSENFSTMIYLRH